MANAYIYEHSGVFLKQRIMITAQCLLVNTESVHNAGWTVCAAVPLFVLEHTLFACAVELFRLMPILNPIMPGFTQFFIS